MNIVCVLQCVLQCMLQCVLQCVCSSLASPNMVIDSSFVYFFIMCLLIHPLFMDVSSVYRCIIYSCRRGNVFSGREGQHGYWCIIGLLLYHWVIDLSCVYSCIVCSRRKGQYVFLGSEGQHGHWFIIHLLIRHLFMQGGAMCFSGTRANMGLL